MTTKFTELCKTIEHKAKITCHPNSETYFGIKVGTATELFLEYIRELKNSNEVTCKRWEGETKNAWLLRAVGFLSRDQLMEVIRQDLEKLGYEFPPVETLACETKEWKPQISLDDVSHRYEDESEEPQVSSPCPVELLPEPPKSEIVGDGSWVTEGGAQVASARPDDSLASSSEPEKPVTQFRYTCDRNDRIITVAGDEIKVEFPPTDNKFDPDNIYDIGKP